MADVDYLGFSQLNQGKDPISSLVRGYATGQQLQGQATQNQAQQMAIDQAKAKQAALKGYAQTGDVQAAMQTDPATGMALEDRQKKVMSDAIGLHDQMKFQTYGNLDFYNQKYRPEMLKLGVPAGMLPEYKTVEELNQGLTQKEQLAAFYKQQGLGPKVVGGSIYTPQTGQFTQPPLTPVQQSQIDRNRATAANQEADRLNPTRRHVESTTTVIGEDGKEKIYTGHVQFEKPPKGADPTKIEDNIRKVHKWKDEEDNYMDRARGELLGSGTYPVKDWKGSVTQVPFAKLPPEERKQVIQESKAKVATRAKRLYEQDIAAEVQKRAAAGKGGGQGKAGSGGASGKTLIGKTPDGHMVYQDSQGNKFVAE